MSATMTPIRSKYSKEQIAQWKRDINAGVIIATRVNLRRENTEWVGLCPFHSEKTPSFKVYKNDEGMWLFKCFGCQENGNVFQFVQRFDKISFPEAIAKVLEQAGTINPADVEAAPEPKKVVTFAMEDYQQCIDALDESFVGQKWLTDRGIAMETARKAHLGFVENAVAVCGTNHPWHDKGWVTFPALSEDGKTVLSIKYRSVVGKKSEDGTSGIVRAQNTATVLYKLGAMFGGGDIFICEGEPDAVVLFQTGSPAVGLPGAQYKLTAEDIAYVTQASRIFIAGDNDTSGKKTSDRLWAELKGSYKIQWPDGIKDANELLLKCGDSDTFAKLLEQLKIGAVSRGVYQDAAKEPEPTGLDEYEPSTAIVSSYPEMGNDLLSQYARLATQGTGIPYGHLRENLKTILAFLLPSTIHFPGHTGLYLRGWHFNVGDAESGKTRALLFILDRWRHIMIDHGIHLAKLSSYGSLQYLTKGFEQHPHMFLYVTEGNNIANANEHVAAIFSGLADLYDQSVITAGSYKNKDASQENAQGSCIICFTPEDFRKAMEGKGVIGGGILPRWTLSESKKLVVDDETPTPESALSELKEEMLTRLEPDAVTMYESNEAREVRIALQKEMNLPEVGHHGKRLIEHFKRECVLAAVFAPRGTLGEHVGVITKEIAEWAAQWARYQLHLRVAFWPVDAGGDVERMCIAMRALLQRVHPKAVSLKQLKDVCHVYRPGSGGIDAFNRAYVAMIKGEEMRKVGKSRKGRDLFGVVLHEDEK